MNALLVVDRDADLCADILNFFRNIGYVASRAADFGGALAQLRERAYDVVLCSVDLSGGAVAELIHAARQADPPAAVIVTTVLKTAPEGVAAALDVCSSRSCRSHSASPK